MNKKIVLILGIFLLFAFTQGVMAADVDNSTNTITPVADSQEIQTESNVLQKNNEVQIDNDANILSASSNNDELQAKDTPSEAVGTTYVVNGSAENQMSDPTIQNAIDKAKAGDTIEITGKSYEHCHFVIDKQLTIISNVGTTMSVCPSNTAGSGGIGIFYFGPNASGSIISGFTLENTWSSSPVTAYGIYVNGAKNIQIENNKITSVSQGNGIYLNSTSNITIANNVISVSKNGVAFDNSNLITLTNNTITNNINSGVYIGKNNKNINILENNISSNKLMGISLQSADSVNIIGNTIADNRDNTLQTRAENGYGVYVNSTIKDLKINGNLISENGNYGVFDTYNAYSSITSNYKSQEINFNIFINHKVRGIFAQQNKDGESGIIYVGSNVFSCETLCPNTYYEPGVLRGTGAHGSRDMEFGQLTKISNGKYQITFINKYTKEVASCLNAGFVTFFLNKEGTSSKIVDGDIYQISAIKNGTAIVNFKNATFKETNNTLVALGPGIGPISQDNVSTRPCAYYNIPDSDIPSNSSSETNLILQNTSVYHGGSIKYVLTDADGNGISNAIITITINGQNYNRTTDSNGIASMKINLVSNKAYTISAVYTGTDDYDESLANDTLNVLATINAQDIEKIFRNGTQYTPKITDSFGNILANTTVTMNINGVFYNRTSDKNGIATLSINLNPGTYIITTTNTETGDVISNTIVVKSNLDQNNNLTKYFKNETQYTIRTLDANGNPIANQDVTFNINGKLYTRTSNANGIATLSINLNPGDYIITASYNNNSVSNSVKVLSTLTASDLTKTYGTDDPFTAKVVDGQGNLLANQNVTFNINGVFYNKVTGSDGIAKLNINLMKGEYIITSMYNGYATSNKVTVKA